MSIIDLESLYRLSEDHPWPDEKPNSTEHPIHGWLNRGTVRMLHDNMPDSALVVELGTWRGLSTRRMLSKMGASKIICVDHWKGSIEHTTGRYADRVKDLLPRLYEAFLYDNWDWRSQIIPLRMNTLDGLHAVYEYGLEPDLIYVDAGHEFCPVFNDIVVSALLFPKAIIVGDDWYIKGVRKAGRLLRERLKGYEFTHNGKSFCFKPSA